MASHMSRASSPPNCSHCQVFVMTPYTWHNMNRQAKNTCGASEGGLVHCIRPGKDDDRAHDESNPSPPWSPGLSPRGLRARCCTTNLESKRSIALSACHQRPTGHEHMDEHSSTAHRLRYNTV
eukprot:16434415-Heterocapsa_arctica.AAC.2